MPYTFDSREFEELISKYSTAKKILAEGDSWFAYPRQFILFGKDSNIVQCLGEKNDLLIYSTASNGDEALSMMSGEQKFSLLKRIKHTQFDLLLFSGGGNDLVGRYDFNFFLKEKSAGMSWNDCIDHDKLKKKIEQLSLVYEELIERALSIKKTIKIVTHTYDIPIPSSEGFELFDLFPMGKSWMYPYLVEKDIKDKSEQCNIVKHVLERFKDMLNDILLKYPTNFFVVNTQGTLTGASQWRNEIHPTPEGFKLISDKIYDVIKNL